MSPSDPPFPASPAEMTVEWLAAALGNDRLGQGHAREELTIDLIGQGRGFASVIARVAWDPNSRIGAPGSVVAKFPLSVASDPSTLQAAMGKNRQFVERAEREVKFFRWLAGHPLPSIPACYCAHADIDLGEMVLLLEDLSDGKVGDALAGCDVDEARAVLIAIGAIHGEWWGERSGGLPDWIPPWNTSINSRVERYARQTSPVFQEFGDRLPDGIARLLFALPGHLGRILSDLDAAPQTLIHADFHLDNLIFVRTGAVILDWQSVSRGPAVVDVAGLLFESLAVDDQRDHGTELLRGYHRLLEDAGAESYGYDRFFEDCIRALVVRFAGTIGWLARAATLDPSGRELALVAAIFDPGRLFQALIDHDAAARLDIS